MQAQTIIAALQELPPDTEVMVQWYTKEDVQDHFHTTYTDEHWNTAVRLFDKWDSAGVVDDLGIGQVMDEAEARVSA